MEFSKETPCRVLGANLFCFPISQHIQFFSYFALFTDLLAQTTKFSKLDTLICLRLGLNYRVTVLARGSHQ